MKVNPKRIPRTEADVRRARDEGVKDGASLASVIFLSVLLDHFGFDQQRIMKCYHHVTKLSEEIAEHRVSAADLRHLLLEEYHIEA